MIFTFKIPVKRLFNFTNTPEEVLSDFKKLNFNLKDNKCQDSSDSVNYNNGNSAILIERPTKMNNVPSFMMLLSYNGTILSAMSDILSVPV